MENQSSSSIASMGPLSKDKFTDAQDLANTFAKALQLPQQSNQAQSQTVKRVTNPYPVTQGASSVAVSEDVTTASLVLKANTVPTIGILGSVGSIVELSGAAPDGTYVLYVTSIQIINPPQTVGTA